LLLQWGLGGLEAGLGTYLVGRLADDATRPAHNRLTQPAPASSLCTVLLLLLLFHLRQWGLGGLEAGLGTYLVGRLDGARSLARLLALQLFHQLEVGQAGEAEGR
jgi:hypothetical protein